MSISRSHTLDPKCTFEEIAYKLSFANFATPYGSHKNQSLLTFQLAHSYFLGIWTNGVTPN